ncbi:MAG: insulinase family protein [Ignavibacteria bacterium]|nr:insulinase family protein [Ignavibacteria bacterium]
MLATSSHLKARLSNIEFEEFDLPNGLHVILHKDATNPIVCVDIWYHVGSKDEDPGRTGFAHLFEHMMFQGSKNVAKTEHFNYIQNAGGNLNGSTNQDRTNYYQTAPSNQLELLLWLESDRMGTLQVTQENFDNQRDVVKEEKRQRYDNAPYGSRWSEMMSRAFKDQTYEWTPIGSMEDLNSADLGYAQEFYHKYYSPDNAVLVISGDIDYDNARTLAEKYFGELKPANTKKNSYPPLIYNQGELSDTIYDNVQLPAVYIAYKIPGLKHKDAQAIELLSMILGDGRSSRLYNEIVYNRKIAKTTGAFVWDNEIGGLLIVYSTGFKNSNTDTMISGITSIIDGMSTNNVSARELDKAKNSIENEYTSSLQTVLGKGDALASYWTYFRNTGKINTAVNDYLNVTIEDLNNAAEKYLRKENRVVLTYLPKEKKAN